MFPRGKTKGTVIVLEEAAWPREVSLSALIGMSGQLSETDARVGWT